MANAMRNLDKGKKLTNKLKLSMVVTKTRKFCSLIVRDTFLSSCYEILVSDCKENWSFGDVGDWQ